MIYNIREENVAGLVTRLEKLNRRGAKLGASPIKYAQVGETFEEIEGEPGKLRRVVQMEVTGETPKFNGWAFLGTLNHTEEGNIIRAIPGADVPVMYRDRPPVCDHCQANRVRRDTYIVKHDDGTFKQVGSNCLHDFLGHDNPATLAATAEWLVNAFEVCMAASRQGGGLNVYRIDLPEYLSYVAEQVLRDHRFITRKTAQAEETVPTAVLAMNAMFPPSAVRSSERIQPSAAAVKLAEDARAFVVAKYAPHLSENGTVEDLKRTMIGYLNNRNDNLSDFEHNLLVAAKCEAIEPKQAGVTAYIIEAFRRSQPKPEAAQLNKAGLEVLFKMFAAAKDSLKHPAIRLADESGVSLHLTMAADTSKNAGCIYVKGQRPTDVCYQDDERAERPYYGKIAPNGRFYPASGSPKTVEAQLLAFAADPETIASKYGKLTGCCCFCGRRLTDGRSTEVGYGPVCADKFGMDWGKLAAPAVEASVAVEPAPKPAPVPSGAAAYLYQ